MIIRVLQVLDKIDVNSGVSSVVMNYYEGLNPNEILFDFMLNEEPKPTVRSYIESKGSRIFVMPKLSFSNSIAYIKKLRRFYKNNDYEIVHGHVANSAVFYFGLAENVPYKIMHSHNTKLADVKWKFVRNWVLTRFIRFVANKQMACSAEAAVYLFGKKHNALILNNAVSLDVFFFSEKRRLEIRTKYGLKDKKIIGNVGRFCKQKNQSFLVDVFNEIHKVNNEVYLMLVGDGEMHCEIVKKVEKLGLKDRVLFPGAVNDVCSYMSAMDAFLLPSLFEGIPLAVIETQACSLQALVSNAVPQEANVSGKLEFLELDKDLWVQKISIALKNEVCRGEQHSKIEGSEFDIKTQISKLSNYYKELLRG